MIVLLLWKLRIKKKKLFLQHEKINKRIFKNWKVWKEFLRIRKTEDRLTLFITFCIQGISNELLQAII